MKILIVDSDKVGLPFALRCQEAGHWVKLWMPPSKIGEGMVEKVKDWKAEMPRADLIFVTDNAKLGNEMEPFFRAGLPIFGPNEAGAKLELDRGAGQDLFEAYDMDVLDYKTFTSYDDAIKYVEKEGRPFVSKPWGGNPDKDLSYVPKTPEDLICRLMKWKKNGQKPEFMLQEMVTGVEMAVGGWFGPGGFSQWVNENWEEKRMMAGGLGPNTGEMGTVMRYVKKSKLFDMVLAPLEPFLKGIKYVGFIDVNCIIDDKGVPWPLEFTCRPGWPHFNLCTYLHQGDPAKWMLDLLNGRDTLRVSEEVCVGVVMAMGDYPWDNDPPSHVDGWPIRGIDGRTKKHLSLSSVRMGEAPVARGSRIVMKEVPVSAGSYVLIASGSGPTVEAAQDDVYKVCDEVWWPPHRTYRNDIGCRLEKDIPVLHKLGFAKGLEY